MELDALIEQLAAAPIQTCWRYHEVLSHLRRQHPDSEAVAALYLVSGFRLTGDPPELRWLVENGTTTASLKEETLDWLEEHGPRLPIDLKARAADLVWCKRRGRFKPPSTPCWKHERTL